MPGLRAHNPKVASSNLAPATKFFPWKFSILQIHPTRLGCAANKLPATFPATSGVFEVRYPVFSKLPDSVGGRKETRGKGRVAVRLQKIASPHNTSTPALSVPVTGQAGNWSCMKTPRKSSSESWLSHESGNIKLLSPCQCGNIGPVFLVCCLFF